MRHKKDLPHRRWNRSSTACSDYVYTKPAYDQPKRNTSILSSTYVDNCVPSTGEQQTLGVGDVKRQYTSMMCFDGAQALIGV